MLTDEQHAVLVIEDDDADGQVLEVDEAVDPGLRRPGGSPRRGRP